MKTLHIASIAALTLCGWSSLIAVPAHVDYYSFGWFGTAGYYPIEYWVNVYDNDGTPGLRNLSVWARYETANVWQSAETTSGNRSHMSAHGYGDTVLHDYADGRIDYIDGSDVVHLDVQFHY